jgi:amino acid adenylation domain-containing protein
MNSNSNNAHSAVTLVDLLRLRGERQPETIAYSFLADGETQEANITYGELDHQARTIAEALQSMQQAGERVLLLYPPGLEYIAAFFGCLYAGAVAVPSYPPRMNRSVERLRAIIADAGARVALTTGQILTRVEPLAALDPRLKSLHWMATEKIAPERANLWRSPDINGDTLAFLQYTSGSTASPKGVMVTHSNLLYNERMIEEAFQQTDQSVIVSWLPLYHDMGLIGAVLQPLYAGARCILMSPTAFLQRPQRWLEAISRYGATTSGGPSFAYELCVRKISPEQRESLDLSSWTVAFNGSEPVRAETLESFARAFEPCGFRRDAFHPCYGLAEATLLVSGRSHHTKPAFKSVRADELERNKVVEAGDGEERSRVLVGCGATLLDQKIAIVNPETCARCAMGEIGEIWVAGPNVARGYWNRDEQTELVFNARISGEDGPFLRTGDLGFIEGGEVFVTGRLKDLVIIRGLNHYPQDIELTVERSNPSLRAGCGAAFSIEVEHDERLVLVQELERQHDADLSSVFDAIREAVTEAHALSPYAIALIKAGTIPKTSSGKLQRSVCRADFLSNHLDLVALWREQSRAESHSNQDYQLQVGDDLGDLEKWLIAEFATRLGLNAADIDLNKPIAGYGVDSLAAIELAHSIETNLGLIVPLTTFLQSTTLAQLAAKSLAELTAKPTPMRAIQDTRDREQMALPPLSHGQRAMWFLHQMAPASAAYNMVTAVRIHGDLDADALHRSFQQLILRHTMLRARFNEVDGEPSLRIIDNDNIDFLFDSASMFSAAELDRRLIEEAQRPFDLGQDRLLRVRLFRESDQAHVLLLSVHHIVADLWSLALVAHELGIIYAAQKEGRVATLAPVETEYSDYAREQSQMLAGEDGGRLWSYWESQLAGQLPILDLATDRPRPRVQTFNGSSLPFDIGAELTERLKLFCRERGVTPYIVLLSVFEALLHRYTGQTTVIVGSPTANRTSAKLSSTVGYFVNPLPIRADFSGDPNFAEFLNQIHQTVLSSFEHQDYPLAMLVEKLHPERDSNRSPLFQTLFVLQKSHLNNGLGAFAIGRESSGLSLADLTIEPVPLKNEVAQFDLTLVMAESEEQMCASLQYNSDLFNHTTIDRLAGHYKRLLQAAIADPGAPISELQMLTEAEQALLIRQSSSAAALGTVSSCIHEMFEAQVERTAARIAIVSQDKEATYLELNRRANQLAHYLVEQGIGPEDLVGILMNRSVEMMVSMLAVLKAGGAYVPMDPTYPQERLAYMMADAGVKAVLVQERLLGSVVGTGSKVIAIETAAHEIERRSDANVGRAVRPENLAYVIYTSGSTGKPKGVAIQHHSAVALIDWAGRTYQPADFAGVLASTSTCFDLSIFELFVPLSLGGTIILAANALQLSTLSAAEQVTLINTVPSAMVELLNMRAVGTNVRVVNLAGEPLHNALAQQIHELGTVERLYNLYGPSEDTTYSTFALINRGAGEAPSIGRPVSVTQAYLFDARMQLVPQGVPGELYIGGEGLARCYLGKPALTAERFLPDPFAEQQGGRLYRTGDLARYMPDGNLQFLGRIDNQVKIRGFRIELGEIEATLLSHPNVKEAVVSLTEVSGNDKRLVAYVVAVNSPITPEELRSFVRMTLPIHMIPSAWVTLDSMPLTPNGKIDRRALPAPHQQPASDYSAPRSDLERQLARIWAELLGLDQVGIHDNFFEAGGHSLLATRVASRVRDTFHIELPLSRIFQTPTIAALAEAIEETRKQSAVEQAPRITRVSREAHRMKVPSLLAGTSRSATTKNHQVQ